MARLAKAKALEAHLLMIADEIRAARDNKRHGLRFEVKLVDPLAHEMRLREAAKIVQQAGRLVDVYEQQDVTEGFAKSRSTYFGIMKPLLD